MDLARPEVNMTWHAWADAVSAAREGGAGSDAGRMRLSIPGLRRRPALAQVLDRWGGVGGGKGGRGWRGVNGNDLP